MLSWLKPKNNFRIPKLIGLENKIVITKVVSETSNAKTFEFRYLDRMPFEYTAGQFIGLKFRKNFEAYLRQYSLSSSSDVDLFPAFTVKRVADGMWSNFLMDHVEEGNIIEIEPPRGSFVLPEKPFKKIFLFAAGSGITPVFAILKSFLADKDSSKSAVLFYSNQNREQIIFESQLKKICVRNPNLQVFHFLSKETNPKYNSRIDEAFLRKYFSSDQHELPNSYFYICGVPNYVNEIKTWLSRIGIDDQQVTAEAFVSSPSSGVVIQSKPKIKDQGAPVELKFNWNNESKTLVGSTETSILDTAIEADLPVSWACLNGVCGSCEMSLKQGQVKQDGKIICAGEKFLSCLAIPISSEIETSFR